MIHEQVIIKRVGMIEVGNLSKVEWQVLDITIIGVLLNKDDFAGPNSLQDRLATVVLPDPVPPEIPIIKLTKKLLASPCLDDIS